MNIKPLADRVLILPAAAEEKTVGGIIIPDTAKEKPLKGQVIAVGNGTKDEAMILERPGGWKYWALRLKLMEKILIVAERCFGPLE